MHIIEVNKYNPRYNPKYNTKYNPLPQDRIIESEKYNPK